MDKSCSFTRISQPYGTSEASNFVRCSRTNAVTSVKSFKVRSPEKREILDLISVVVTSGSGAYESAKRLTLDGSILGSRSEPPVFDRLLVLTIDG